VRDGHLSTLVEDETHFSRVERAVDHLKFTKDYINGQTVKSGAITAAVLQLVKLLHLLLSSPEAPTNFNFFSSHRQEHKMLNNTTIISIRQPQASARVDRDPHTSAAARCDDNLQAVTSW
jgi:hypothetical protein